jgi:hypothetical protein
MIRLSYAQAAVIVLCAVLVAHILVISAVMHADHARVRELEARSDAMQVIWTEFAEEHESMLENLLRTHRSYMSGMKYAR